MKLVSLFIFTLSLSNFFITKSIAQIMPIYADGYSIFDINGIEDTGAGIDSLSGAAATQFATITPTTGAVAGSEASKPAIYRQLPSKVAPVQTLPTVTNYRFIQQPVIQQRKIDQPINQKRYVVQPVLLGRTIYQPLQQKIAEQTIVQPQVTQRTAIYPHVIEQPVLQKQYQQEDTYVQTYQQTHGVQPTQTQPATFTAEQPQTVKGGVMGGVPTGAVAGDS